ncbi:hypothetical protein VTK56DRAFT_1863 [Thermocarpiscus australiensis]
MAFSPEGYYSCPPLARQPLESRASSVSSTSSSTSYSAPHPIHYGSASRTLSPISPVSDQGVGNSMFVRSHYQGPAHEQPHANQSHPTSLMPSPSPYHQAQFAPSLPLYSPVPTPRQFPPASSYGYHHHHVSLPQQPSPLSFQTYPHMYPSFATTAYHSSTSMPPYQTSPPAHRLSIMATPEIPKESSLLKNLQRLPSGVISEIQKNFTWLECWKIYRVCRWFRDNFHPNRLPEDAKLAGMLYVERFYPDYHDGPRSLVSSQGGAPKKNPSGSKPKPPKWFGCYHCFTIKGFEHFELSTWGRKGSNSEDEADFDDSETESAPKARRGQRQACLPSPSPPSPPSNSASTRNPHYEPGLTRSSIQAAAAAAAASSGRRARGGAPSSNNNNKTAAATGESASSSSLPRRVAETWGIRRFCIDCGIRMRLYRPLDLIDLHNKEAVWVCKCWKLRRRPAELKCRDCGSLIPLWSPSRRR